MDLRHLRYFVAVAEELHFTRAANRLGIQQPPLSLQIRQLEEELGTKLFLRLTRGVELTESGALLLEEAHRILNQVERTKTDVQSLARGTTGHIRMGFGGATYFQPLVSHVIRAFRERYPRVILTPQQSVTAKLLPGLRRNEVDIAFVRPPIDDTAGLNVDLLVEEPFVVVLPSSHPAAANSTVRLASLADETFIFFPRLLSPGFYDTMVGACQRAGFTPKFGQETPNIPAIVLMVAAGFGVSIVPCSLDQIRAEGIAYLAIEDDVPKAALSIAYSRDLQSQAVRNFIAVARRLRLVGGAA